MSNRESLWTRLKNMWRDPLAMPASVPIDAEAQFSLRHNEFEIGTLTVRGGVWRFVYSEGFKRAPTARRTITEFPDVNRVYESKELWPFFLMRIPSLRQAKIREIINQEHIDEHDEVELLKRFGRRTIANPFELISEQPFELVS